MQSPQVIIVGDQSVTLCSAVLPMCFSSVVLISLDHPTSQTVLVSFTPAAARQVNCTASAHSHCAMDALLKREQSNKRIKGKKRKPL